MSTLEEAANAFARDIMTMNFGGLMTVFTPEGMMKAMALQGQLLAQAQAAGQPATPPVPGQPVQVPAQVLPTGYEVQVQERSGEDYPVLLSFTNPNGTGVFQTTWREIEGVWKVNDLELAGLNRAE